jgi:hypothetical protein
MPIMPMSIALIPTVLVCHADDTRPAVVVGRVTTTTNIQITSHVSLLSTNCIEEEARLNHLTHLLPRTIMQCGS